jgi:hypothetical protein
MLRHLYRATLWLCPSEVRRDLADDLEEAFAFSLAIERARRPWWWQPLTWIRGLFDGLAFALAMRRDGRRRRRIQLAQMQSDSPRSRRPLMRLQDIRATLRMMRSRRRSRRP